MARNQAVIECLPGAWTQLTNGDASIVTFQVHTSSAYIRFTTDATTPTESRGLLYREGEGELMKYMSELSNLAGADRMWAKPEGGRHAIIVVDTD